MLINISSRRRLRKCSKNQRLRNRRHKLLLKQKHLPLAVTPAKNIPSEEKEIRIDTDLYSAVFSNKGATVKHFELKKYKDANGKNVVLLHTTGIIPALGIGSKDDFDLSEVNFHTTEQDIKLDQNNKSGSLIFEYAGPGVVCKENFHFSQR